MLPMGTGLRSSRPTPIAASLVGLVEGAATLGPAAEEDIAFPSPANHFVVTLGVFNLDVVGYVPAKCLWTRATFYTTLLVKTLAFMKHEISTTMAEFDENGGESDADDDGAEVGDVAALADAARKSVMAQSEDNMWGW